MSNAKYIETNESATIFSADYLAAKKTIDDAALNLHVLQTMKHALHSEQREEPLQVLEIGAGIGTMFARLVERDVFSGRLVYRLTDNDYKLLLAAKKYLTEWAQKQKLVLSWPAEQRGYLITSTAEITVILGELDIFKTKKHKDLRGVCDLIVVHGVLDLFDFQQVLPSLFHWLKHDGLFYSTCNFDGETNFLPEHPADREIIRTYHNSMEKRTIGASHTGRRLLDFLYRQHAEILAAGSSDWVLYPKKAGFTEDQKLFLFSIHAMIEKELTDNDNNTTEIIDWMSHRRQQIVSRRQHHRRAA